MLNSAMEPAKSLFVFAFRSRVSGSGHRREFKVQSQHDKPEFDGTFGRVVSVATKSGNNKFQTHAFLSSLDLYFEAGHTRGIS